MSFCSWRSKAVKLALSKLATLKLVARVTSNTFIFSPWERTAWGSALHSVIANGSKPSQPAESVYADLRPSYSKPGRRLRYTNGGMFIIDKHGTREFAIASISVRRAGERY